MKPAQCVLAIVAIALSAAPVSAATFNENAEIEQIAHGMAASETAVACQLRTSEWRKSVLLGYIAAARIGVMSAHPDASDNDVNAETVDILQAAKVKAALNAQFAAPTKAQCEALNASHDMQEMDAAAKIGLLFGATNNQ